MTPKQFEALAEYIRAVAAREAQIAVSGSAEGGYDQQVRTLEEALRCMLATEDA